MIITKQQREAINNLVVLAVNMNISLKDLLAGNYRPEFEAIIETFFSNERGLLTWDFLKRSEANYIKSSYDFVVAFRHNKNN